MHIRKAQYADAPIILEWNNTKSIWVIDNPAPYRPKQLEEFTPQWQAMVNQGASWVIEEDGAPVGHIGWFTQAQAACEIYIIIGEARAHGRGMGRAAMHWLFDKAGQRGLLTFYARVLGSNPYALSFFSKLGFIEIGRIEQYFERGDISHDLHWMRYHLVRNIAHLKR